MISLQKYLCAVCNEGGGVIIIGAVKKDEVYVSDGIRFKSL